MNVNEIRIAAIKMSIDNLLSKNAYFFHGKSMEPFFYDGDYLLIKPVQWENITCSDIICYHYQDKFPARRVLKKQQDSLLLWCDNLPNRRFIVPKENVLGRIEARQRGESWLYSTSLIWKFFTMRSYLKYYLWSVYRLFFPYIEINDYT